MSAKLQESVSKTDCEVRTNVQKGKRRRKHHLPWTQPEVMKLIEGIAQLGVGRWSKIKKLLFSSSKHRTSVDLKVEHIMYWHCSLSFVYGEYTQFVEQLSGQMAKSVEG